MERALFISTNFVDLWKHKLLSTPPALLPWARFHTWSHVHQGKCWRGLSLVRNSLGHWRSCPVVKCPYLGGLQTAEVYHLWVLEVRKPKSSISRAATPLKALGEGYVPDLSTSLCGSLLVASRHQPSQGVLSVCVSMSKFPLVRRIAAILD